MIKKAIIAVIVTGLVAGTTVPSFASDWDKAGKVLAVFEGLRILTGGKADVLGTVTGINRPRQQPRAHDRGPVYADRRDCGNHFGWTKQKSHVCERIWVPHYVWKEKYIPQHIEYRDGRKVYVEEHYEKFLVEQGGHWEYK